MEARAETKQAAVDSLDFDVIQGKSERAQAAKPAFRLPPLNPHPPAAHRPIPLPIPDRFPLLPPLPAFYPLPASCPSLPPTPIPASCPLPASTPHPCIMPPSLSNCTSAGSDAGSDEGSDDGASSEEDEEPGMEVGTLSDEDGPVAHSLRHLPKPLAECLRQGGLTYSMLSYMLRQGRPAEAHTGHACTLPFACTQGTN